MPISPMPLESAADPRQVRTAIPDRAMFRATAKPVIPRRRAPPSPPSGQKFRRTSRRAPYLPSLRFLRESFGPGYPWQVGLHLHSRGDHQNLRSGP
jgi:hypothetical protein